MDSFSIHSYYKILEASASMTDDELKRQFRKLAKRYHPDVNSSPQAKSHFVANQEAYEKLMAYRSSPHISHEAVIDDVDFNKGNQDYFNPKESSNIDPTISRNAALISLFLAHIGFIGALVTLVCLLLMAILRMMPSYTVVIGVVICSRTLLALKSKLNWSDFGNSIPVFLRSMLFRKAVLIASMVFVFISMAIKTDIPTVYFFVMLIPFIIAAPLLYFFAPAFNAKYPMALLWPFVLLYALVTINYVFATEPRIEYYSSNPNTQYTSSADVNLPQIPIASYRYESTWFVGELATLDDSGKMPAFTVLKVYTGLLGVDVIKKRYTIE